MGFASRQGERACLCLGEKRAQGDGTLEAWACWLGEQASGRVSAREHMAGMLQGSAVLAG